VGLPLYDKYGIECRDRGTALAPKAKSTNTQVAALKRAATTYGQFFGLRLRSEDRKP